MCEEVSFCFVRCEVDRTIRVARFTRSSLEWERSDFISSYRMERKQAKFKIIETRGKRDRNIEKSI